MLLAAVTGAVTGFAVALFDHIVVEMLFERVLEGPVWMGAMMPAVGLMVAAILLRFVGRGTTPATSDEYIRAFHDPEYVLSTRHLIARIGASIATLGSGGPMGLEGPSLYGGAAIGSMLQRRLPAPFRGSDGRTLLVAGAAAGVAAIFKAPATGAIFAIEVPFRNELARRMLLPALVASASGYLAFVAINGTDPILRTVSDHRFGFRELFAALLIGALCAIGARAFAKLTRLAKRFSERTGVVRVLSMGLALAAIFAVTYWLTGEHFSFSDGYELSIGSGYEILDWLVSARPGLWLLVSLFVLRSMATAATLAGGGVGGLFIPLVVGGSLVGQAVGQVIDPNDPELHRLIGMAAFLGAGYRVPLAGVMFVAETTGKPGFIVPSLFAAVTAELVMGGQSITAYQRERDEV